MPGSANAGWHKPSLKAWTFQSRKFIDVNLRGVTLSNVNLQDAKLTNVNLANVRIGDANIAGLTISGWNIADLIKAAQKVKPSS